MSLVTLYKITSVKVILFSIFLLVFLCHTGYYIDGLIKIMGMEKYMLIWKNSFISNTGHFMVMFNIKSQCEIMSSVFALFRENVFDSNSRLLLPGVSISCMLNFNF